MNWLRNIKGSWRDVICPCGSTFHFDGSIDDSVFMGDNTY